jgi:hypothetical protein
MIRSITAYKSVNISTTSQQFTASCCCYVARMLANAQLSSIPSMSLGLSVAVLYIKCSSVHTLYAIIRNAQALKFLGFQTLCSASYVQTCSCSMLLYFAVAAELRTAYSSPGHKHYCNACERLLYRTHRSSVLKAITKLRACSAYVVMTTHMCIKLCHRRTQLPGVSLKAMSTRALVMLCAV